jgi:flagellar biosynthesis/type III secretory pathway ATPase
MLTNTQVSDADLVALANERGQRVKDFLTHSGEVPLERVFLIAPKLEAPKPDDKLKGSRTDFALK